MICVLFLYLHILCYCRLYASQTFNSKMETHFLTIHFMIDRICYVNVGLYQCMLYGASEPRMGGGALVILNDMI